MAEGGTYRYTDAELGQFCRQELAQAAGADDNELANHISRALQYYYNRPRGDEKAGESQVQSSDLSDMVNAVLAQLTPMVSQDALVKFDADGSADEQQAAGESAYINDLVMNKNRGYIALQECLKDASLCRNSFACVYYDEEVESEQRTFSNVDEQRANMILAQLEQQQDMELQSEEYDPETMSLKVVVAITTRAHKWRSVDPGNVRYARGWESMDLEKIRFFAELDFPTRSELVEGGVPREVVAKLNPTNIDTREVRYARDQGSVPNQGSGENDAQNEPQTEDQERIERNFCYLNIDMDGDGIAERWLIELVEEDTVIHKERVAWIPYVVGSLFISSHRLQGEDLFDHLKQVQDVKTAVKRRWLDSLYNGAWSRIAADKNTVQGDIDDARQGATVWTDGNPGMAIQVIPYNDIGEDCLRFLAYEDQHREERGGAALDMQSAQAQLVGETAQGIEKQYSVREMLTAMMAKNMAETLVRSVYLMMHRTVRAYAYGPVMLEVADQMVQSDPATWRIRTDLNVTPGLTPSQRTAVTSALMMQAQAQMALMQQGLNGQLASVQTLYRTFVDFLHNKGVPNPETYWIDPSSPQAQQAAQQAAQQQQAQAQAQQQMAAQALGIEQAKIQQSDRDSERDFTLGIYKTNVEAELKEAELVEEGRKDRADTALRAREQMAAARNAAGAAGAGANRTGND